MRLRDLTELAGRNLREALLRNSLTTLGIAVGVASLVAMLSLGVGLQEMASSRLAKSGLFDAVFVTSRANMRAFGGPRRDDDDATPKGPPRHLDEEARQDLVHLPNVTEVYPEVRFQTEIQFDGKPYATTAAGIPLSAQADGAFDGMRGTFFTGPAANEAILQLELAKDLSKQPDSLVGKDIVLRYAERRTIPAEPAATGKGSKGGGADSGFDSDGLSAGFSMVSREVRLRIIGIVETEPAAGFGGMGRGRLLIPLQTAQDLRVAQPTDMRAMLRAANGKPAYESLTVRVKSPSAVRTVEESIKAMGFGAFSIIDATKNIQLFFRVFDSLLAIFGSLALTVASLGIINTLAMAILERRREIGVLKALGAADRDVQRLFFAEAGAMGLAGGIVGVFLGWLIGKVLTLGLNLYLARQQLPAIDLSSVTWWMVVLAIVTSILVSLAAGIYPASRAARLDPVEALRYE
jgi:ABC-type antimicrobial peptide transport system permease subunit